MCFASRGLPGISATPLKVIVPVSGHWACAAAGGWAIARKTVISGRRRCGVLARVFIAVSPAADCYIFFGMEILCALAGWRRLRWVRRRSLGLLARLKPGFYRA